MRIDYAVIGVVIADMALKPSSDDIGTLTAFAAVVVVVAAVSFLSGRDQRAPAAR